LISPEVIFGPVSDDDLPDSVVKDIVLTKSLSDKDFVNLQ
jgi:hypothetical protein